MVRSSPAGFVFADVPVVGASGVGHHGLMDVRLADPIVGLSAIGDLSREREPGQAARTCFLACRLARSMGQSDDTVRDVFYTALLQHLGCTGYAHDTAAIFAGRDIAMNLAGAHTDFSRPGDLFKTFIPELSDGADLMTRVRIVSAAITRGPQIGVLVSRVSCEVAETTARRIGLGGQVQIALRHIAEWYDGKGGYLRRGGDEIPLAARVVATAFTAAVFDGLGGPDTAIKVVKSRAGRSLDPDVAAVFAREGSAILAELSATDVVGVLLDEEPDPPLLVGADDLDAVSVAFGEVVDLKTPFTHGGARRAFDLADAVARSLRLEPAIVAHTRRAAALRDVGKTAIPNAVLEKPGPLTLQEREEVRLHAYHSERVLARSPALAQEACLAAMHHERLDGSGYHRAAAGPDIGMGARVVAAVDAFVAMTQPRPHRDAMSEAAAGAILQDGVRDGRFDGDAVGAVLAAVAGRAWSARPVRPAGLSERQVAVLRLVAAGLSNKHIAQALGVSTRTAEHHVQDIYQKIGVSSRAAAALFAMEHQLL